jgi:hypothetical protein
VMHPLPVPPARMRVAPLWGQVSSQHPTAFLYHMYTYLGGCALVQWHMQGWATGSTAEQPWEGPQVGVEVPPWLLGSCAHECQQLGQLRGVRLPQVASGVQWGAGPAEILQAPSAAADGQVDAVASADWQPNIATLMHAAEYCWSDCWVAAWDDSHLLHPVVDLQDTTSRRGPLLASLSSMKRSCVIRCCLLPCSFLSVTSATSEGQHIRGCSTKPQARPIQYQRWYTRYSHGDSHIRAWGQPERAPVQYWTCCCTHVP